MQRRPDLLDFGLSSPPLAFCLPPCFTLQILMVRRCGSQLWTRSEVFEDRRSPPWSVTGRPFDQKLLALICRCGAAGVWSGEELVGTLHVVLVVLSWGWLAPAFLSSCLAVVP
ncbi:unnamed protein product [Linum trigynum]|uniref:Uncharacterized protein n=1 Tax=Linum trigynum TaxID=586398 RepID=A0AAV2EDL8_9ROSI